MSDPSLPEALQAAHAFDPNLMARARANAERLVAGVPNDHAPQEEPAHTYLADKNP
jgi:hypothetical protein